MQLPRDVIRVKGKPREKLGKTPGDPRLMEIRSAVATGCHPFTSWDHVADLIVAYHLWAYRDGDILALFPCSAEQAALFLEVQ